MKEKAIFYPGEDEGWLKPEGPHTPDGYWPNGGGDLEPDWVEL